ncbi:NACHT domain-containing protein [Streptomyces sp. NPDC057806]|uniref:NACHT domain-containing protein n=1 Tax=Streptomyces sp. NPDC057806 TaxID=3346255 RepID=UPI0036A423CE
MIAQAAEAAPDHASSLVMHRGAARKWALVLGGIALAMTGLGSLVWTWKAARTPGQGADDMAGILSYGLGAVALVIGTWLSGIGYRGDRRDAADSVELATVADDLRTRVRHQWESEAQVWDLHAPKPLPVSWHPAQANLVDSWPTIVETAKGWPDHESAAATAWASRPAELAGSLNDITDVFRSRIPTRRLVILGQPGAGKSMLLIRLVLALASSSSTGAVPVLFSLATWNPTEEGFYAWMARRLARDYVWLAGPAPRLHSEATRAEALIQARLILPILDGFDEIPPALRPAALKCISEELKPGQGLILASRLNEFRNALGRGAAKLSGAAGIELKQIRAEEAAAYLTETSSRARWEPVISRLGTRKPVGRALSTPLMLFLARTIYNPRPGEQTSALPNPSELCDRRRLPTQDAVEEYLFDAYIPAAYRPPNPWSAQAEDAMVYLAQHLQRNLQGTPDLAWWQLHRSMPEMALILLAAGVVATLDAYWMALRISHIMAVFLAGFMFLVFNCSLLWMVRRINREEPKPVKVHWSPNPLALVPGMVWGLLINHFSANPFAGVAGGIVVSLPFMFRARPEELATAVGPTLLLQRDRHMSILQVLKFVLIASPLMAGAAHFGWDAYPVSASWAFATAPLAGTATAISAVMHHNSWARFAAVRHYLWLRRRLPRRLLPFLADAHANRGVLRQVGAVYQFRHIGLQQRLASRVRNGVR